MYGSGVNAGTGIDAAPEVLYFAAVVNKRIAVADGPAVCWMQLQEQCAAQQRRAEAAEADLAQERSAHRRDMRRKNKELAESQVGSSDAPPRSCSQSC